MAWAELEPGSNPQVFAIGADRAEYGLCKQIPGARFGEDSLWRVSLTWPTYACFRDIWRLQPIRIYPELAEWADGKWAEIQLRYKMRNALDCGNGDLLAWLMDIDLNADVALTPPQRGAVDWLTTWRRVMYGDPRGNGKTPPLARSMWRLHETGELAPALVIAPPQGLIGWQRKLATWAPGLRTVIIRGSAKQRSAALERIAAGEAEVGIIDWGNVRFHTRLAMYPGQAYVRCDEHGGETGKTVGRCEVHLKEMNTIIEWGDGVKGFRTVVPDEAHWMADPTSKQTRAVWWLMHHAENTWPTTGTLQPNDVGNLWPVLHGLDPLAWPVRSKYLDQFAIVGYAFAGKGQEVLDLNPAAEPTFRLITEPWYRRIAKQLARPGEAGLAEPEFLYPEMTPKQRRIYDAIASTGIAEMTDRDYVPANTVVAFTRLCQLAGSMIKVVDGEDPMGFTTSVVERCLPSHKISALLEFLDAEDGQWIVGLNSPTLAAFAAEKLAEAGIASTHILGGMTADQKDAAEQSFMNGDARVIFINQAGREVIDLQVAEGIAWLEPNPSYVHREQLTGRGDRFGRQGAFRQVWFLTPGTVDTRLYQLGTEKEERHETLVRDTALLRWMMDVQPGEINEERQGQKT